MKTIDDLIANSSNKKIHRDRVNRWVNSYLTMNNDRSVYAFIDWFISNVLSKVTLNSGKNYLRSLLAGMVDQNLINYVHVNSSEVAYKPKDKTKKKCKKISWEQFLAIDEELSQLEQHLYISDWLRCSILTGLRPKEWCNASIFYDLKGRLILKVKNTVKATLTQNGEHYNLPEHRIIPLMNYDEADIDCIKRHLAYIRIAVIEGLYEDCYESARKKIYHVSKKLFPGQPTINLYTGRHQFSANLKKSGVSMESAAFLMGHNDLTTSRHSYGAKRHGEMDVIDIESTEETIHLFQELFAD
ncbi:hypothetical protein GCM10011607_28530 [Shewanella inventionis]|uniref:Site-specific integrase n=1 Tax=Shewanella inventionis TaxID=1738770 RepID=A0ABQ1JFT1_9GAMM|nr:hypothetical protein [Shewanella inventionis]GGB66145.1 hypothetical protein GCM10011607_28530 [Shewanella inventionis]